MKTVIILLKIAIALELIYIAYRLYVVKKADATIKLKLDIMSWVEVGLVLLLSFASLFAVLDETTYIFTIGLSVVSCLLIVFDYVRLVFVGDNKFLLGGKIEDKKEVLQLSARWFVLKIDMKKRSHKVYVPLSSSEAMEKLNNKKRKK